MSAKTGVAPTSEMVSALLIQVNGVVMTSSPGPMSNARMAISRAWVPLETATQLMPPSHCDKVSSSS